MDYNAVTGLIAAQYGAVSDIEIFWTVIALTGLGFSIWNVHDAREDRDMMPKEVVNGRRALATLAVRMEWTRVFIQTIFALIGFLSFTIQDPPDQLDVPFRSFLLGTIARWGFVVCAILVLYQSYANYRVRRDLRIHPITATKKEGGE